MLNRLLSRICILALLCWMESPLVSQDNEPGNIAAIIDRAEQTLNANSSSVNTILSDPNYLSVHAWPRFRELIKKHAPAASITIVTPQERGKPLQMRIRVVEADDSPSVGALVYFYHTDARGDYGPNDANVPLAGSDNNYARLFGYAVTDSEGSVEVHTIRPGGYPGSDFPQHIHLRIWCNDRRSFGGEIWFDDDPRVDREAREEAARIRRIVICPVTKKSNGHSSIAATIRLD